MNEGTDLTAGLLGHWPGEISPGGIVRDQSGCGIDGNYGLDARWIWFTNPRAIHHQGDRNQTYLTYVGGESGADLVAAAYDHDAGTNETTVLDPAFSRDDHTNPALHVRNDGHLLAFWSGHNGEEMLYTISKTPESVTDFEPVRTIEQESVTYPNPMRAPWDDDLLYLFYRDRVYTQDVTDDRWGYMGDGNLYYRTSDDGGESWSEQTRLVTPPNGHYSMYFLIAAGGDQFHFFFTDAERGGDAPKWNIMHAAFVEDEWVRVDGTPIEAPLPLAKADLDVIYDSHDADGSHCWIWDAAVDDHGHPIAVYATFPHSLEHTYRYARWDGAEWNDYHLASAGRHIAQRPIELHYSGGLSIDRDDPNVVYGAVSSHDGCSLYRFETKTDGQTWSQHQVAQEQPNWHMRPVVPRGASPELPVIWLAGSYKHMDTSQTVLRGLPTDSVGSRNLWGDGQQGVDLGLDLYHERTFTHGISVAATVTPTAIGRPGVIANCGGAAKLGTALTGSPGIDFVVNGPDGKVSVAAPALANDEQYHVTAQWDGERTVSMSIDGEEVSREPWDGPLTIDTDWSSWTLLKDEYLFERGFRGTVSDVRLYDRPLSAAERTELAYGR